MWADWQKGAGGWAGKQRRQASEDRRDDQTCVRERLDVGRREVEAAFNTYVVAVEGSASWRKGQRDSAAWDCSAEGRGGITGKRDRDTGTRSRVHSATPYDSLAETCCVNKNIWVSTFARDVARETRATNMV